MQNGRGRKGMECPTANIIAVACGMKRYLAEDHRSHEESRACALELCPQKRVVDACEDGDQGAEEQQQHDQSEDIRERQRPQLIEHSQEPEGNQGGEGTLPPSRRAGADPRPAQTSKANTLTT